GESKLATGVLTKGGSGSITRRRGPGPPVTRSTAAARGAARAGAGCGAGVAVGAGAARTTRAGIDTAMRDVAAASALSAVSDSASAASTNTSSQPASISAQQARLARNRRIRGSSGAGEGVATGPRTRAPVAPAALAQCEPVPVEFIAVLPDGWHEVLCVLPIRLPGAATSTPARTKSCRRSCQTARAASDPLLEAGIHLPT